MDEVPAGLRLRMWASCSLYLTCTVATLCMDKRTGGFSKYSSLKNMKKFVYHYGVRLSCILSCFQKWNFVLVECNVGSSSVSWVYIKKVKSQVNYLSFPLWVFNYTFHAAFLFSFLWLNISCFRGVFPEWGGVCVVFFAMVRPRRCAPLAPSRAPTRCSRRPHEILWHPPGSCIR